MREQELTFQLKLEGVEEFTRQIEQLQSRVVPTGLPPTVSEPTTASALPRVPHGDSMQTAMEATMRGAVATGTVVPMTASSGRPMPGVQPTATMSSMSVTLQTQTVVIHAQTVSFPGGLAGSGAVPAGSTVPTMALPATPLSTSTLPDPNAVPTPDDLQDDPLPPGWQHLPSNLRAQYLQMRRMWRQMNQWTNSLSLLGLAPPVLNTMVGRMGNVLTGGAGLVGNAIGSGLLSAGTVATLVSALPIAGIVAAVLAALTPMMNTLGRGLGQAYGAFATGEGQFSPIQLQAELVRSSPQYWIMSRIPFVGPMISSMFDVNVAYLEAAQQQRYAAMLTGQVPLVDIDRFSPLDMAIPGLRFFIPQARFYTQRQLQTATELMLYGYRFLPSIRERLQFVEEFGGTTPAVSAERSASSDDARITSIMQSGSLRGLDSLATRLASRFAEVLQNALGGLPLMSMFQPIEERIRAYESMLLGGRRGTTGSFAVSGDSSGFVPANIIELAAVLRQALMRRMPAGSIDLINQIDRQTVAELASVVRSPEMTFLYGFESPMAWQTAVSMLALSGQYESYALMNMQYQGRPMREIALEVHRLRTIQQLGGQTQQMGQLALQMGLGFGTRDEALRSYSVILSGLHAQRQSVQTQIGMVEQMAPELMLTPRFRELELALQRLNLQIRETEVGFYRTRLTFLEAAQSMQQAFGQLAIQTSVRGTAGEVSRAVIGYGTMRMRQIDERIAELRELRSRVGELERYRIDEQIAQLESQRYQVQVESAVPPTTAEFDIRRMTSRALYGLATTTFAQWGDIRGLLEDQMRLVGERIGQLQSHIQQLRRAGMPVDSAMMREYYREVTAEVQELARLQMAYENRWLDRLISQVWNAPASFDTVAAEFTRREASLFYGIAPQAFGGTRERAEYWRETIPSLYRSMVGRIGTQEGMMETAMSALSLAQQSMGAVPVEMRIQVQVYDAHNRLVDETVHSVQAGSQTGAFLEVPVKAPAPSQY